jgi:hypothetical protein
MEGGEGGDRQNGHRVLRRRDREREDEIQSKWDREVEKRGGDMGGIEGRGMGMWVVRERRS